MKKITSKSITQNLLLIFALSMSLFMVSCDKDVDPILAESTYEYQFHNGQTVPTAAYSGLHTSDLNATMELTEMDNGNTMIKVTLDNTIDGQTYNIHAHDAADAATTPNGTPYNESPNATIFAKGVAGTGGTVSVSQEATMSYNELTSNYAGFFVIHDPLQPINTADITSYLIVGSFARTQTATDFDSTTFNYDFNNGQLVEAFGYVGDHATNLSASINVSELASGESRVTVMINNTMDGMTYASHAHDMADPATTPNGTPYNETPNANVFVGGILGNGGTAGLSKVSSLSYSDIISSYDGFFVIHDPLQAIDTTNPASYIILGVFAR